LVTGAGVGIGRAIALALGRAGARVGLHHHASAAGAVETLAELQACGGGGWLFPGDLTQEAEANALVDRLVESAGRLDILVNNAGSPVRLTALADCPTELWRHILDVNLTSAFLVTRRAIPALRAAGQASIVNNLSLSVQTGGRSGAGPYAAAKGGLEVLTRTLARELAPGVRVNASSGDRLRGCRPAPYNPGCLKPCHCEDKSWDLN
jgi:3-oxoacyl-[acyl-carrier protein] reductase